MSGSWVRVSATLAALLLLIGCRSKEPETAPAVAEEGSAEGFASVAPALCEVIKLAGAGRNVDAKQAFVDTVHDDIHLVVSAVEGRDRAIAGELLRRKQSVEGHFSESLSADRNEPLVRDLEALVASTKSALERLGLEAPPCA